MLVRLSEVEFVVCCVDAGEVVESEVVDLFLEPFRCGVLASIGLNDFLLELVIGDSRESIVISLS